MKSTGAPRWRAWLLGTVVVILFLLLYLLRFISGSSEPAVGDPSARSQVQIFEAALDVFHREVGRYPSDEEGLEALIMCPPGLDRSVWKGPYLKAKALPRDPWGNKYVYVQTASGLGYEVISRGRDGAIGTEDDIGSGD